MVKSISLIVAGLVAVAVFAVLVLAAGRPDSFRIERTVLINAGSEKIVPLIEDFRRWPAWSPWEKIDPDLKRRYGGAERGVGAVYEWHGNADVGKGRMEILGDSVPSKLVIKLDFFEPFEAHNTAEFSMESEGAATKLTWAMFGPSPYLARIMHMFWDMDRMVGDQFETGLASLKAVAEK